MQLSLGLLALWASTSLGQSMQECTRELARTDECADVINPNACYNMYRFNSARTLSCIEGKDDAERKRKACMCCTCVGTVMCNWLRTNRYC
ncbi:hypothetical protein QC762_000530 [Podospora pseudocomata]|uniref:Uncharacterized protein n=5 Tax=Sordariales TaxID=5139 RepID=A0AA39ZBW8_9PEZI|nr:hypothetical protein QBC41DRAFT_227057 [Cercophora samala]KAK4645169.1 hypothetical protein QC761_000530 [Podospora bellae-mahoneyi]KAK4657571.1 hypothetical protein QC762_000530 [Podospora pseudocomata]KAK4668303.1 hypothetical protein QC763_000530 [Podospora pseudopauciseta]KAK4678873.1 hypothetical protein QC764_000530 [Podospora pseudoanserina]